MPIRLEKISFAILSLLAFVLPLAAWPWSSLTPDIEKRWFLLVGVGIVAALWLVSRLFDRQLTVPKSWLSLTLFLIILIALISALSSAGIHRSLIGFGYESDTVLALVILTLVFLGGTIFIQTKERLFLVFLGIAVAGGIIVIYQIIQTILVNLIGWPLLPGGSFNLLGKWNEVGLFWGLTLSLALAWFELLPKRNQSLLKYIFGTVLGLSLLGLIIINFLSAWVLIAGFAAVVFFSRWWWSRSTVTNRRPYSYLALGLIIISFVFIFFAQPGSTINTSLSAINTKIGVTSLEVNPSWAGTLTVFKGMIKEQPIFGVGPNAFNLAWNHFKPTGVNETPFWNSDFITGVGFFPTFLITTGLAGIVAWLIFLVLFLYSGFLAWSHPAADETSQIFELINFLAASYLFIVLIIYPPTTAIIFLAFLLGGSFIGSLASRGIVPQFTFSWGASEKFSFLGLVITGLLIAVVAIFIWFVSLQFAAAAIFTHGLKLASSGNIASGENWVNRAADLSGDEILLRSVIDFRLNDIQDLLNRKDLKPEEGQAQFQQLIQAAVAAGQLAVKESPSNYANWVSVGHVYEVLVPLNVTNAYEAASNAYDQAIKLNPTNPSLWLEKARLEVAAKDQAKARAAVDQALVLKRNYTDAVFLLAQLEAESGNLASAIKQAEQATKLSPTDPVVFFQLGFLNYQANYFNSAVSALEQAVALNGNYANARYFLGLSYDALGQSDKALAQFQTVAKTNPDNQEIAQIVKNLTAGRHALENTAPPAPKNRKSPPVKDEN